MTIKVIFLIFAISFLSFQIKAQESPIQKASEWAIQFATDFSEKNADFYQVQSVIPYIYHGETTFYIVNFEQNRGYVLVSTEANSLPIIGFVPDSKFTNVSALPEAMQIMLSDFAKQVIELRKSKNPASERVIKFRKKLKQSGTLKGSQQNVNPLLSSIWSQGCYFNDSTPFDPGAQCMHAVTGCVATAMGQVLYYHQFPPRGSGSHSYQSAYGLLSANFGNTVYDWQNMADTLNSQSPSATVAAVSQLLSHCGIAVDMMYSAGSSGAYSEDALRAMVHYFNYSPQTQMLYRDNYVDTIWEMMVRQELDSMRPLYYDGSGTGGHAFVCDGYQNNHYFHFNWGWNGSNNGWFLLSNLNPGGMYFGQYNSAFFGLEPQLPVACSGITDTLTTAHGHINDGSSYQDYLANTDCSWLIQPTGAVSISLDFYTMNLATDDTLYVYAGSNSSAPLAKKITGDSLPASMLINSSAVYFRFVTNNQNQGEGWSASYRAEFCNGYQQITSSTGTISDGSGNFLYNNSTDCFWHINPSQAAPIRLHFTEFRTEAGYDYLRVYDGSSTNAPLLGVFDGSTIPNDLTASSGEMLIHFSTDGGVVDQGWSATFAVCENLPQIISSKNQFCTGDSVELKTTISANSIEWFGNNQLIGSDTATMIFTGGNYFYTTNRILCGTDTSDIIQIMEHGLPQFSLGTDTFVCQPTANFNNWILPSDTNVFHFIHYQWNTGDTTPFILIKNHLPNFIANDTTIAFILSVIDSNLCGNSDTLAVNLSLCASIMEAEFSKLELFPNPATDYLQWKYLGDQPVYLEIFDLEGRLVKSGILKENQGILDVSTLNSGIFNIRLSANKTFEVRKWIKL
ncbi:MAG: C10 family peptidase [Bacteroidales bacterium]|nr:C10 family peptidase [Bacteroidales bacterium]